MARRISRGTAIDLSSKFGIEISDTEYDFIPLEKEYSSLTFLFWFLENANKFCDRVEIALNEADETAETILQRVLQTKEWNLPVNYNNSYSLDNNTDFSKQLFYLDIPEITKVILEGKSSGDEEIVSLYKYLHSSGLMQVYKDNEYIRPIGVAFMLYYLNFPIWVCASIAFGLENKEGIPLLFKVPLPYKLSYSFCNQSPYNSQRIVKFYRNCTTVTPLGTSNRNDEFTSYRDIIKEYLTEIAENFKYYCAATGITDKEVKDGDTKFNANVEKRLTKKTIETIQMCTPPLLDALLQIDYVEKTDFNFDGYVVYCQTVYPPMTIDMEASESWKTCNLFSTLTLMWSRTYMLKGNIKPNIVKNWSNVINKIDYMSVLSPFCFSKCLPGYDTVTSSNVDLVHRDETNYGNYLLNRRQVKGVKWGGYYD